MNDPIVYDLKSGKYSFYDDFLITEIGEGETVGKESLIEVLNLIKEHFGDDKPYGVVSHRLHSYSINLSELIPIANKFGRYIANAVVVYSEMALHNFEIEKRLLRLNGEVFFNLEQAIDWVQSEIKLANQSQIKNSNN